MSRKPGTKPRRKRFRPVRRSGSHKGKENCIPSEKYNDGQVSTNGSNSADCSSQCTNPGRTSSTVGQDIQIFPQSSPSIKDVPTCRVLNESAGLDESDKLTSSTASPHVASSKLSPDRNVVIEVQEQAASLLTAEAPVGDIEVFDNNSNFSIFDESEAAELIQAVLDTNPEEKSVCVENERLQQPVLHSDISLVELSSDVIFLESPTENNVTKQEVENAEPPTTESVAGGPLLDLQMWHQVETYIVTSKELPLRWETKVENNCFHMYLMTTDLSKVVRSVRVEIDGTVALLVHGKYVPAGHDIWQKLPPVPPLQSTILRSVAALIIMVYKNVRDLVTCIGVPDGIFSSKYSSCYMEEGFEDHRYRKTLRSTDCLLLVHHAAKRCSKCSALSRSVKMSVAKLSNGTPPKKKPDSCLLTPEAKARTGSLRRENRALKIRNRKLSNALMSLEKNGVELDSDLSNSLSESVKGQKLTDFQKILIESQEKCAALKDKRSVRWHPAMIRFALNIRCISGHGYHVLKKYLELPDERTLFDYSHAFKTEEGIVKHFVDGIINEMGNSDPYRKYFILAFDEMFISQNLVYCKETGAMVGYCKLNEVEQEMRELEEALSGNCIDPTPPIAKAMLTFMVRGVFSSIKQVVAFFGTNNLTSDVLYQHHWDVVEYLEISGMQICGCVSDGASANRTFIKMHVPVTVTASGVVFDTYNIYSSPRRIYHFFADVPHLLKTLRNNFASKARKLTINNQRMHWALIQWLYKSKVEANHTLLKSYKLTAPCVYLNSYSQMKVSYAAKVFSETVANDLEQSGLPNISEVINFIRKVNDFFDMLNGNYFTEAIFENKENLAPYMNASDGRLGKLDDFLEYLRAWERQVSNLPLPAEEKNKMFISDKTYEGIEMTIRAFKSFIKIMLPATDELAKQQGKPRYILARVINQDKLEKYFGQQRARHGGSKHPNQAQFFSAANTMFVTHEVAGYVRGGNTEKEAESESVPCMNTPVPKRKKVARGLTYTPPS